MKTIELINYGKRTSVFSMTLNDGFFANDAAIIKKIESMKPEYPNEPIYRKTWRFVIENRYHFNAIAGDAWAHSPSLLFNSIGFGFCDDSAAVFGSLVRKFGYQTRVWGITGHVIAEVYVNGRWEMYDPDMEVYFYNKEGKVAGVEELADDPDLIVHPIKPVGRSERSKVAYTQTVADLYASKENNTVQDWLNVDQMPDYDLKFTLPPGGKLELPAKYQTPLLDMYQYALPSYADMKLTVPAGWSGEIAIPLVVHAIKGKGTVTVKGIRYDIDSPDLKYLVDRRAKYIEKIGISNNNNPIEIIYLINPSLITVKEVNRLILDGQNADSIIASVKEAPDASPHMKTVKIGADASGRADEKALKAALASDTNADIQTLSDQTFIPASALVGNVYDENTITVNSRQGTFTLPQFSIKLERYMKDLGEVGNFDIVITIAKDNGKLQEARQAVRQSGGTVYGDLVYFDLKGVNKEGRSFAVDLEGEPITRTLKINDKLDTKKAAVLHYDPNTKQTSTVSAKIIVNQSGTQAIFTTTLPGYYMIVES